MRAGLDSIKTGSAIASCARAEQGIKAVTRSKAVAEERRSLGMLRCAATPAPPNFNRAIVSPSPAGPSGICATGMKLGQRQQLGILLQLQRLQPSSG